MIWRIDARKRFVVSFWVVLVPLLLVGSTFALAATHENSLSIPERTGKYWRLHEMSGDVVGIEVADFDRDGQEEIALLFRDRLEIGRFQKGVYSGLASLQLPAFGQTLGISSTDLDGDGRFELYVSLVRSFNASSLLIEYRDKRLEVVQSNIHYLLRSLHMPDSNTALIGQQLERNEYVTPIYDSTIWQMGMIDGKIRTTERLDFPHGIDIFALQPFTGNDGQSLFANISSMHKLHVFDRETKIWKSEKKFGGTTISFEVEDFAGLGSYSIVPVLTELRLELGPAGTLLVPRNEGKNFNDRYSNFGPSRIVAMRWENGSLQEAWHTKPQEGGLIDFRLADADNDGKNELVMVIIDAPPKATSRGKASLVVCELQ